MNQFSTFKHKQACNENCNSQYEASFIINGTAATIIHSLRLDKDKRAALTITETEGPDTTLVFTYRENNKQNELLKGDYFTWITQDNIQKTYLVYEDVDLVHSTAYKKQKSYECNVNFTLDNIQYNGYFISSLRSYVDTTLENKLNIADNTKPILVLAAFDWIETGTKIIIKGQPFKIIDFDAITNDGIVYCSLDSDFISKQEDIQPEPPIPEENILKAGIENILDIYYGYFKADIDVDIISKNYHQVKFIIPYGSNSTITIHTKDVNKNDIETIYKVVI